MDRQLTTAEVARELGIDPSRVRRLAVTHNVGSKHGRDWLFDEDDIDAMRERKPGYPAGRPRTAADNTPRTRASP